MRTATTARTIQLQKRFSNGNSISTQYTRSSTRDTLNYLNPQNGELEDRISPNDRPNRFSIGTRHAPAVRPERALRVGLERRSWTRSSAAGSSRPPTSTSRERRWSWGTSLYYSESCGDPKDLKSNIGAEVGGGIAGLDVPAWDVSCFYFHDAPVQVDGVVNPALQRADTRIQLGNNVRYFPSTLPNVRTDDLHLIDLGISKNFALAARHAHAGALRVDQRAELHRAVESEPESEQRELRVHYPGSQQPARSADRLALHVLTIRDAPGAYGDGPIIWSDHL